ncbi:hypothetical protein V3C99_014980 [Haemonchus contortus]|uniref:Uncharacterized protein n=1 Tax=Haemonchus contortus TaxID=6289 RepID=A0A7I4YWX2_HAECO
MGCISGFHLYRTKSAQRFNDAQADLADNVALINLPKDDTRRRLIRGRLYDHASRPRITVLPVRLEKMEIAHSEEQCTKFSVQPVTECMYIGWNMKMLITCTRVYLPGQKRGRFLCVLGNID